MGELEARCLVGWWFETQHGYRKEYQMIFSVFSVDFLNAKPEDC
jgi:hypothetical protein